MSRARSKGGSVLLVVLTGVVVMSAMTAGGTPAVGHQATPTQATTDATISNVRSNGTASNTTASTSDNGWNMGRANAANTNYINTTGPTNPITARWTFASDANTFSAGPLVTNGTVYFATRYYSEQAGEPNGKMYAVDAWTGEVRWTFATSSGDYPNSIAVLRNTVYVGGEEGDVYALDAATGDEYWSFRTSKVFGLAVANRTLYVRDRQTVYALGALRGEEKWRFKAVGGGRPTGLAVKDGTAYVSTKRGHVYGLDAQSGTVTWDTDVVADIDIDNEDDSRWLNPPVVANGLVYVGNRVFHKTESDSNFYALDAQTGEARWTRTAPRADTHSDSAVAGFPAPSVRGDTIYFTGTHLRAVDATTGTNRWSKPSLRGGVVLLNDIGYIRKGGADGALYTLDPATGAHHARFTPPPFNNSWDRFHSPMAVLNGSLYTGVGIDEPTTNQQRSDQTIFYALGTPEFNYTELSITPQSPDVNETMTATVTVRNTGTGPGTFNATLIVNGNATNTTTARLDPRTNRTVTLTHTFQQNGTYTVAVANLTRRITVGDVTPAPTPTPTTHGDSGSPTQTAPAGATATAAGGDTTPAAATPTATSGSVPGFGVSIAVVAGAVVVGALGRRRWT